MGLGLNVEALSTASNPATNEDIAYLNFDGTNKKDEVKAIAIFNYSTWYQFRDYFATLGYLQAESTSINRIVETALFWYSNTKTRRKTTKFGNAKNRSTEQATAAREHVERILDSVGRQDIVAYTDGSSHGNPGPAGSGIYLSFPVDWKEDEAHIAIPLGHSTNNVGELYAIGAASEHILNVSTRTGRTPDHIHFISDSSYSLGCITLGWRCNTNKKLVGAVKQKIEDINTHNRRIDTGICRFHWTPGHAGVTGNDNADNNANIGSKI